MVNRRNGNQQSNKTFIGGLFGFKDGGSIGGDVTSDAIIRFTHYIAVDQKSSNEAIMYANLGGVRGNGDWNTSGSIATSLTVLYIGGGSSFKPATIGTFEFNNAYASGYNEAKANVKTFNITKTNSIESYVPSSLGTDGGKIIEEMQKQSDKAYCNECTKSGSGIFGIAKVAWNYTGYLRHVAIS